MPVCSSREVLVLVAAAMLAVPGAGCSKSDAPERFAVWGKLTYEGEPIPSGMIIFHNKGTPYDTVCSIEDGYFESDDGKGHTGGTFSVSIDAYGSEYDPTGDEPERLVEGTYAKEVQMLAEGTELNLDFKEGDFK